MAALQLAIDDKDYRISELERQLSDKTTEYLQLFGRYQEATSRSTTTNIMIDNSVHVVLPFNSEEMQRQLLGSTEFLPMLISTLAHRDLTCLFEWLSKASVRMLIDMNHLKSINQRKSTYVRAVVDDGKIKCVDDKEGRQISKDVTQAVTPVATQIVRMTEHFPVPAKWKGYGTSIKVQGVVPSYNVCYELQLDALWRLIFQKNAPEQPRFNVFREL